MRSTNASIPWPRKDRGLIRQNAASERTAPKHLCSSACIRILSVFDFFRPTPRASVETACELVSREMSKDEHRYTQVRLFRWSPLLLLGSLALAACQQMTPTHLAQNASGPTSGDSAALSPAARLLIRTDPAEAVRQLSLLSYPSPAVLNNLGVALDLEGKHEQAQVAYREALSAQPGLPAAMNNLALSLALAPGHSHESARP